MKKPKLGLFVLCCLALTSCAKELISSSVTPNPSDSSVSTSSSSSVSPSSSPITSSPIISSPSESSKGQTSSSSSSAVEEKAWSENIEKVLRLHLGDQTIPYFPVTRNADAAWIFEFPQYGGYNADPHIEINDTNSKIDDTYLENVRKNYLASGWTEDTSKAKEGSATFVDNAHHLKLVLEIEDTILVASVYYDEPYDAEHSALTDWPDSLKKDIQTDINKHDIPYFYTGTEANFSSVGYDEKGVAFYGGKWNADILNQAEAAFTKAGYENITKSDSSYSPSISAVHKEANGDYLTVSAKKSSDYCEVIITMKEAFKVDPTMTDWDQTFKDEMNADFHGHLIPYFYIGTTSPTTSGLNTYSGYPYTLTATGEDYYVEMLEEARKAFNADNAKVQAEKADAPIWVITDTTNDKGKALKASKTFDDGCSLEVLVGEGYGEKVRLFFSYYPKYDVPEDRQTWEADTLKAFNDYIHGHTIPYVYLNEGDTTDTKNKEKVSFDDWEQTVKVLGGDWNKNALSYAKGVFENKGWTVTKEADKLTATHTFDGEGEDGCTVICTLTHELSYDDEGFSGDDITCLKVQAKEKWDPSTLTAWGEDVNNVLTNSWNGAELPFLYLGTKNYRFGYSASSSVLTLTGNTWDENKTNGIVTNFKAAYDTKGEADPNGWTWTNTVDSTGSSSSMSATGTHTSGAKIEVSVEKTYYGFPRLKATYYGSFNPDTSSKKWSDDIKNAFTTAWGKGVALPFVYLGTDTPEISGTDTKNIKLTGSTWNKQVLTVAKEELEDDGWKVSTTHNSYDYALAAYKTFTGDDTDENSKGTTIYLYIYSESSSDSSKIILQSYYAAPLKAADLTVTDWGTKSADIKSALKNHDLPFFAVPVAPSSTLSTSSDYGIDIYTYSLPSNGANINYLLKAKEQFDALEGAKTNFVLAGARNSSNLNQFDATLYAELPTSDGGTIALNYYFSSTSYNIYATYYSKFVAPTGTDAKWSTTIQEKLDNDLLGETLPYIYLGTMTPTLKEEFSTATFTFTGSTWDEKIFTEAEAAFTAADGWTTYYDDIIKDSKSFIATKFSTVANKQITVTIYDQFKNSYGSHLPTMIVTLK